MIAWLKEHIRPNGQWTDERVIIFTEYRATQKWLSEVMSSEGFTGQDRLMTMYGGMDAKSREAIKAAFQAAPDQSPVRILLATDAASEGIDLQNHCSRSSSTTRSRGTRTAWSSGTAASTGTVRRLTTFEVFHFVSKGYKQRQASTFALPSSDLDADLEFLMRVAQKVETIREDLGSVGQVLADDVEAAMLGRGYNLARTDTAERGSEPVRKMLKFERDLAKQIQALLDQYRETQKELRLSPANVQKVVEVGLTLAQQPPAHPDHQLGRQADLPPARLARKLGGVCRGPGASRTRRRSARSPSTMPWPTGGTTWCSSTSTTGWSRCACGCSGPRSGRTPVARRCTGSRLGSCPTSACRPRP